MPASDAALDLPQQSHQWKMEMENPSIVIGLLYAAGRDSRNAFLLRKAGNGSISTGTSLAISALHSGRITNTYPYRFAYVRAFSSSVSSRESSFRTASRIFTLNILNLPVARRI